MKVLIVDFVRLKWLAYYNMYLDFTEWEEEFIIGVSKSISNNWNLSDMQVAKLREVYSKKRVYFKFMSRIY